MSLRLTLILALFLSIPKAYSDEITVGWIGALSGDAAAIGTDNLGAVRTYFEKVNRSGGINGSKLRLIVEDDGYDIQRTLSAYEKLKGEVTSKVIFASTYGALFALRNRPERDGIVILDTLDCNDQIVKISPNHLCLATRTESIADNFLQAIGSGGPVAVLYEEEAWFNFIVNRLEQKLGSGLLKISAPVAAGDYRAEVVRLKSAGIKDLIILGNDSMGRAVKQAADLSFTPRLYSIAGIMSPGFRALSGDAALEGAVVSHWEAGSGELANQLRAEYEKTTGKKIALEFVAAPSFDGARAVAGALASLPNASRVTAETIRAALINAAPFTGVAGTIDFDPDGAVRSIVEQLYRFKKGALVPNKE